MLSDERAQSEVVGTVLLVGVVVITVSTLGAGLLGSVTEDDDPLGDVSGEVATDEIRLTHRGGESLAVAALEVVVRTDDGTERISFADGALSGPDPDRFDPGETWTKSASFDESEEVRVYLVHESERVLYEGRKLAATPATIPTPTTPPETTITTSETTTTTDSTTETITETTIGTTTETTTGTTTETTTETTTSVNDPLTADLTVARTSQGSGNSGDTYEFDASGSTGDIVEYRWDFDDDGTIDQVTTNPVVSTERKPNKLPDRGRVIVVGESGETDEATANYSG